VQSRGFVMEENFCVKNTKGERIEAEKKQGVTRSNYSI